MEDSLPSDKKQLDMAFSNYNTMDRLHALAIQFKLHNLSLPKPTTIYANSNLIMCLHNVFQKSI